MWSYCTVIVHDADLDTLESVARAVIPGHLDKCWLSMPRFSIEDDLHEELDAFKGCGERPEDCRDRIGGWRVRDPALSRDPEGCGLETVKAVVSSRAADTPFSTPSISQVLRRLQ